MPSFITRRTLRSAEIFAVGSPQDSPPDMLVEKSTRVTDEMLNRLKKRLKQKVTYIKDLIKIEERFINTELYELTNGMLMLIRRGSGFRIEYK